ncbi:MAG: SH3 domain-containing protein [Acetatifactor sp.]|nr:SH3 domain-containing protein [Acetatifactor sp.]
MWKDKAGMIRDFILRHSVIVFPVIVIVAVAVTVVVALGAGESGKGPETLDPESLSADGSGVTIVDGNVPLVPLVENTDQGINTLISNYYNAMAEGDTETIASLCDEVAEQDLLRYQEMARYIANYPVLEIYTKPGSEAGATIAYVYYRVVFDGHEEELPGYQAYYVCTNEQGTYYIKRGENSQQVNDYIQAVCSQDDVIEFNNRVTVEYNELMTEHPELLAYQEELTRYVDTAVGEIIAQRNAETDAQENNADNNVGDGNNNQDAPGGGEGTTAPSEPAIRYATATTTVNVRSSDSENADRLGKVSGGTKVQVLEQRVNGWTKVLYEGKDGYIKSEYLQLVENASDAEVIGTVTATTNVNVRAAASETADRLGILAGGEVVNLLANENGWCKINYNGQVGYVKADYVE